MNKVIAIIGKLQDEREAHAKSLQQVLTYMFTFVVHVVGGMVAEAEVWNQRHGSAMTRRGGWWVGRRYAPYPVPPNFRRSVLGCIEAKFCK